MTIREALMASQQGFDPCVSQVRFLLPELADVVDSTYG